MIRAAPSTLVAGLLVATGLAACGSASTPTPGPIVFTAVYGETLMVMNPDGTGVRPLGIDGLAPSWSPDGKEVVFERGTEGGEGGCDLLYCSQIWIVGIDGSAARRLTPRSARSMTPDWSPDGERIAFSQYDNATERTDIYVMNVDGSNVRRLTTASGENSDPAWSPDGNRIAFSSDRDGHGYVGSEIYVMDADGSSQQRLTHTTAREIRPAWSPGGQEIAVERSIGQGTPEIFQQIVVMQEDGSKERTLSSRSANDAEPAWSPAGKQIAFTRPDLEEAWVMDADGRHPRKLKTGSDTVPCCLDWAAARD